MKRFSAILLFGLVSILILVTAYEVPASEPGPYVGIFGGYVIPKDLKLENSTEVDLDNSWGVGAKIGYNFPGLKWLSAELEYAYLAKQDVNEAGVNGDFKAHNLMANLIAKLPEGKFHPYVGVGGGCSWGSVKASALGGLGAIDESDNAFAWQLMAGVAYDIAPNFTADLGYRFIQSKYKWDVSGGEFDGKARNNMFTFGLTYYFGGAKQIAQAPAPVAEPAPEPVAPAAKVLAAPVNLKATAKSDSKIDTTWDAVDEAAGYKIYRDGVFLTNSNSPNLEDMGLKADSRYCYTVTAVDKDGKETVQSNTACAKTLAAAKEPTPVAKELMEKGRATIDIKFDFNKAVVKKPYFAELNKFADVLKTYPDMKLAIEGHTDNIGTAAYNEKLSLKRAEAIKDYLVKKGGIDASRLTAKGYGFSKPIADNKTKEGRMKNRRVEAAVDYIIKK